MTELVATLSECGFISLTLSCYQGVRASVSPEMEILGSASPPQLNSLQSLVKWWFSPQALTLGMPYPSCMSANFVCPGRIVIRPNKAVCLVPVNLLSTSR